jgi:hypothetical protein
MAKIVRIHEKILDHLIKLRKSDDALYFVPRKINNKGRLDEGYWFRGDENYLNLSFWDGSDWKERVHNVGFIVLKDKSSLIEFSAQDSNSKAKFLEKLTNRLGGFKKLRNSNKWQKHYSDNNYLENLDHFITKVKPVIDELVKNDKPQDINLLDKSNFNKYGMRVIEARRKQIIQGSKNKLVKICWNTEGWKFPSGSKGKSIATDAYESDSGFGHEEWLFDKSRIIDGYHYAFLQPLNLKTAKHHNQTYNVSLFTINNLNRRYFVGEIKNVECISREDSTQIYDIYRAKGWINNMLEDIEKVGANPQDFLDTESEIFFNVRFKFEDVVRPDDLIEISEGDINITTNRYKLLPQKASIEFDRIIDIDDDFEGNKRNTKTRKKIFNGECEYDPYHDQMQNEIFELLKSEAYSYDKVYIERDRVDIKAKTKNNTWEYFELKTDNPKQSIRKALGQILEYAYFPNREKAEKLIIIADEPPSEDVIRYLEFIRDKFSLPIFYRYFNLKTKELSCDY